MNLAWARREALIKRLECDALETAALFDERTRKPPRPLSAAARAEARRIWDLAERLRANPDSMPSGPFARAIVAEVERLCGVALRHRHIR